MYALYQNQQPFVHFTCSPTILVIDQCYEELVKMIKMIKNEPINDHYLKYVIKCKNTNTDIFTKDDTHYIEYRYLIIRESIDEIKRLMILS